MAKETFLTNREISKWLAQGNGEVRFNDGTIQTYMNYKSGWEIRLNDDVMIRKWFDTEWHKPTKEYIAPKGHYESVPNVTINQSPFIPNSVVWVNDENENKPAWFRQ